MDYMEKNKDLWDQHFANTNLDYPNETVVRFLAKCKNWYPNGVLLDWGCATGRHTTVGCRFGFQVIAADYVEHCVEVTREKVKRNCNDMPGNVLQYVVNKGVDIEEVDAVSVDAIIAWGVLFYNTLDKQRDMINNMYRMLKSGGRAFCDFRTEYDSICQQAKEQIAEDTYIIPPNSRLLEGACVTISKLDKLEAMLKSCGFEIEFIEKYEFTEDNQQHINSWWHVTLLKPEK